MGSKPWQKPRHFESGGFLFLLLSLFAVPPAGDFLNFYVTDVWEPQESI